MRFRKKSSEDVQPTQPEGGPEEGPEEGSVDPGDDEVSGDAAPAGPFDETDVDLEGREFIDLGSLLVTPADEMEMRLQVDEQTHDVIAAVLVTDDTALELRAFAASRGGTAWDDLRPRIAAETARLGGTATEQDGPFGPELRCRIPVQTQEGPSEAQTSRVMGHQGPRWLLRATLMGSAAEEETLGEVWEQTIRNTVVRRGRDAMAPGAPLPLRLPPEAQRID